MGSAQSGAMGWGAGKWAGRKLTQNEIPDLLTSHFNFLKRRAGGIAAVMTNSDLSGLNLAHATLTEANLSGASLVGAKLTASSLDRASLVSADLRNCDLRYASLIGADARGASLKGADLSHSMLDGADFRSAVMFKGPERGVRMKTLPDSQHMDGGVDFSGASLKGASFKSAVLKDVNFENALLHEVLFAGAVVKNARLKGAVITGVERRDLPFSDQELKDCILTPDETTISRANSLLPLLEDHHRWAESGGARGKAVIIDGEDIRPLARSLAQRKLTAMSARKVIAIGVDFAGCELQGTNFENADLRDTNFVKADLRGANFAGANLSHACFDAADFGMLQLEGGQRIAVNLDNAIYREEQFAKVQRAPA